MHIQNIISTIATIIIIAIAITITSVPVQAQFIVNQSYFQDPFIEETQPPWWGDAVYPRPHLFQSKFNETYEALLKELSISLPEPENKTAAEE